MSVSIRSDVLATQPDLILRLVRSGTEKAFGVGDLLLRQGDASTSLFYILSGRVAVERSSHDLTQPVTLAELRDGEILGEMGVLDGRPRSASARAVEPTRAVEIGADLALEALAQTPETSLHVMKLLAERLRATDDLAARARP